MLSLSADQDQRAAANHSVTRMAKEAQGLKEASATREDHVQRVAKDHRDLIVIQNLAELIRASVQARESQTRASLLK